MQPLPPLDPRRPLHMLYICIMTFSCPKGILGLGVKASKNKLKDTSFIFSKTNITFLSIIHTHAQKGYCKVLETKAIYILNNLVLLLFENLQMDLLKILSKRHPVLRRKLRGVSRKRTFSRLCK